MLVANYYPNRITVTSKRSRTHTQFVDTWLNRYHKIKNSEAPADQPENLKKKKSTLNLSSNSVAALRNSVNSLVFLSQPRTVYTPAKKPIYNFRASFVTLTLPAQQAHTDVELKKCLDLFLQDIRRAYNVKNYVWRSELQNNGNIHFHLVFDVYIYHKIIRRYWLKALRHTGYVQAYQKKFFNMPFTEYKKLRFTPKAIQQYGAAILHKKVVKAYAYGKRTKWLSPNCTDVKSVHNVNQMSAYVSKYLAKEAKNIPAIVGDPPLYTPSADRVRNFGKVWGRSTSLSRLKYIFPFALDSAKPFIDALVAAKCVYTQVYEYATIHYFNFKAMPPALYRHIHKVIFNVAKTWEYPLCPV